MRIDYGSGYRVSYTIRRRVVVILLAGGIKKTQTRDIKRGHEILAGLDEWRKKENPLLAVFSRAARRLWPVYAVPPDFFLSQTKMTDSIVLFESQDHEIRLDAGLLNEAYRQPVP